MEDSETFDRNEACFVSSRKGERRPRASFIHRAYNLDA